MSSSAPHPDVTWEDQRVYRVLHPAQYIMSVCVLSSVAHPDVTWEDLSVYRVLPLGGVQNDHTINTWITFTFDLYVSLMYMVRFSVTHENEDQVSTKWITRHDLI